MSNHFQHQYYDQNSERRKLEREMHKAAYLRSISPKQPAAHEQKPKQTVYYVPQCRECSQQRIKCLKVIKGERGQWDGYMRWSVEYKCPKCGHYVMQTLKGDNPLLMEDLYT